MKGKFASNPIRLHKNKMVYDNTFVQHFTWIGKGKNVTFNLLNFNEIRNFI